MALNKDYKDIKYGFEPNSAGDVSPVYDERAINQSLQTLFLTMKGERFFNLSYGSNIKNFLHEPLDVTTAKLIVREIEDSITFFEGRRIQLDSVNINTNYDDNNYEVNISYSILSTNQTGELNLILPQG